MNCWKAKVTMHAMLISSQAAHGANKARGAEGSETRGRAKAVIPPRASHVLPAIIAGDEDIVRYLGESLRGGLNSRHNICNPKTKADLVKTFFPKERYDLLGKTSGGMVGLDIQGFTSPAGDVLFEPDVFISDGGGPTAAIGDAAKRPETPTVSTGGTTPADGASQFTADDAGSYFYTIQACNRYGRSVGVPLVAGPTAIAVAAGDKTTWGMTPGGSTTVSWYEVFRTQVGGATGTERLILRVPNAAGAGAQTLDDYNASLPYTTSAFLFQGDTENMSFKQLAPMIKIPLGTIDSSIRWMQLLYGVPVLYTPGKNVLFTNVGRSSNFVGQP